MFQKIDVNMLPPPGGGFTSPPSPAFRLDIVTRFHKAEYGKGKTVASWWRSLADVAFTTQSIALHQ